jgi:ADP-ribose pyrophosphatase
LHNAAAYSDEFIEIWFARGLQAGAAQLDADELLDVCEVELDTIRHLAAQGELTDAKTQIGLLWVEQWAAGRWQPQRQTIPDWCVELGIALPDSTLLPLHQGG